MNDRPPAHFVLSTRGLIAVFATLLTLASTVWYAAQRTGEALEALRDVSGTVQDVSVIVESIRQEQREQTVVLHGHTFTLDEHRRRLQRLEDGPSRRDGS